MGSATVVWLIWALAFVAAAGVTWSVVRLYLPNIRARLEREAGADREVLTDLFFEGVTPRTLLILRYLVAPVTALVIWLGLGSILFGLGAGVLLFLVPKYTLEVVAKKRRERIEGQVLDLISSITATTKAGMNLAQSIEEVATRMPPPISQEFAMILQRVRAGQRLETALEASDKRLNILKLSLVIRSLIVNQQRGGKLPELLEKIGVSVRELERVEERVKTETSGIRLASRIMGGMPFIVGFILYMMSPDHVIVLFNTLAGNAVLALALLIDFIGFSMIRKLSQLEV